MQLALGFSAGAEFSECRRWRYTLVRKWAEGPRVAFLMFNPSTADEAADDATIRRCRGFSQAWAFGGMAILNLFAIRGTDPKTPGRVDDPIGPHNDWHILTTLVNCDELVCAWGCSAHMPSAFHDRAEQLLCSVHTVLPELPVVCLGRSKDGSPRHPLMLAANTSRQPFSIVPTNERRDFIPVW